LDEAKFTRVGLLIEQECTEPPRQVPAIVGFFQRVESAHKALIEPETFGYACFSLNQEVRLKSVEVTANNVVRR